MGTDNEPPGTGLGFDLVSLCPIELNMDAFLLPTGEESLFFLLPSVLSISDGLPGTEDAVEDAPKVFSGEPGTGPTRQSNERNGCAVLSNDQYRLISHTQINNQIQKTDNENTNKREISKRCICFT